YQKREIINTLNKLRSLAIFINITRPFFQFTTTLSKTKDITVYLIFTIYNKLFDHLKKSIKLASRTSLQDISIVLARDILSIPTTSAGVKRLFNTTRDIYHYRRGSLNTTTIQELILYRITFRKEYLSKGEIEADHKEKDTQQLEGTVDPISNDKESDKDDTQEGLVLIQAQSATKRRKSTTSKRDTKGYRDSNEEEDVPLPETQ
ncbi:uncharacterized protein N7496_004509, partial [Penicillium cataractarum]